VLQVLSRGCKWTKQYDLDIVLPEICALHFAGNGRKLAVHVDNARRDVSTRVKESMEDHN
jgi:hypothetical protein